MPHEQWREEFRRQCVGTVDGEQFAFVPLTESFIAQTRKEAVREALEEIGETYLRLNLDYDKHGAENRCYYQEALREIDHIIRKHIEEV